MTLTAKHVAAGPGQAANLKLLVSIAQTMGANKSQMAGAMATMIQESVAVNMQGGDRDSAGLFQQRPSMGWGTYAQVTNPTYAIKKFLSKYMPLVKRGVGLFEAAQQVQGSGFPDAPRQWYTESWHNVIEILGSGDYSDATGSGTSGSRQVTRNQPYEFSRGSAQQREDSWTAIGRLASEVQWDRFMRAGALWFVSEAWLKSQPPRFLISQGARGVLSISFDNDARRQAAEMTVTALAKRWSVLPGDVVQVSGEGPGDGLWLVSDTRRTFADDTTEISLKRPMPKLGEPAPQTTTVTVGGTQADGVATQVTSGGLRSPEALYLACKQMSDRHIPYSTSHRTLVQNPPDADCSSSCCWALLKAGFPLPGGASWGAWAPVSGAFSGWGTPGRGRRFTVMYNAGHIWIRFYNFPAKHFNTAGGYKGEGPRLRTNDYSEAGYNMAHFGPDS